MLRFIQQGIHKVKAVRQHTRGPCQKGAQESDEYENKSSLAQKYQFYHTNAFRNVPLSHPLPDYCGSGDGASNFSGSSYQRPNSSYGYTGYSTLQLSYDIVRAAVVGAGVLLSSVHGSIGQCSGRKGGKAEKSKLCPVAQFQKHQRSNYWLRTLSHLLPGSYDTSPGFNVLPKGTKSVLVAKEEKEESLHTLRVRDYEKAKSKVKELVKKLSLADADHTAADHMRALRAWDEKNYAEAVSLFEKTLHKIAAPTAAYKLGVSYEKGCGVKRDVDKAAEYYSLAASQKSAAAMYSLASLALRGEISRHKLEVNGKMMSPDQLMKRATSLGYAPAMTYLGTVKFNRGERSDALQYFKQAAAENDPEAYFYMGICHEMGVDLDTPKDDVLALEFYTKAAKLGHPQGMYNLAVFIEEGYGGQFPDLCRALIWYKKSADQGCDAAKLRLAELSDSSIRSSLSLPAFNRLLPIVLSDLDDLPRTASESHIRKSVAAPDVKFNVPPGSPGQGQLTPASSMSSIASGAPKFFLPTDDVDESSASDWTDDTSTDSVRCDGDSSDFADNSALVPATFGTIDLLKNRQLNFRSCSKDSLGKPEQDGLQIIFA